MFAESLPDQCPPANAKDRAFDKVFRAIPDSTYTANDFLSKAAKGDNPLFGTDPCKFASCSLYTNQRQAAKMLQYPDYHGGAVAELNIQTGSGKSLKKKQHVDFWAYKSFDFCGAVQEVHDDDA